MADGLRELLYSKERIEETVFMLGHAPSAMDVLGVVVEIGIPQGAVVIAGYANGDARLLWSMGGGVFGDLYQQPRIAEAARALCAEAQALIDKYQYPAENGLPALPAPDNVRMAVLTREGRYATETPGPQIILPNHPLEPTFTAANKLFEELQALQEAAKS